MAPAQVPNGVVRDIYPLTGNNAGAAGFNLFGAPGDRDGAVATVREQSMTLVGPLKFYEGGYGVIVRVPVFVPGVDANEVSLGCCSVHGSGLREPVGRLAYCSIRLMLIS